MSERFIVQQVDDYGDVYLAVVDTRNDQVICAADCHETPEDANVHRHFRPLILELNMLAETVEMVQDVCTEHRQTVARLERELAEAHLAIADEKARSAGLQEDLLNLHMARDLDNLYRK